MFTIKGITKDILCGQLKAMSYCSTILKLQNIIPPLYTDVDNQNKNKGVCF